MNLNLKVKVRRLDRLDLWWDRYNSPLRLPRKGYTSSWAVHLGRYAVIVWVER